MFDQFQLIQLFKVETAVNPTTRLKSTTTRKRVATRRLRNAGLKRFQDVIWVKVRKRSDSLAEFLSVNKNTYSITILDTTIK